MSSELPASMHDIVRSAAGEESVTPARLLLGRAGTAYRTSTQLRLRADHAFAKDALSAQISLETPPLDRLAEHHGLFEIGTEASSHEDYLSRPDRGRRLSQDSITVLRSVGERDVDVQIVLGDGLSPLALAAQAPSLLGILLEGCRARGWSVGVPFFIRHCRVGVMNDVGEILGSRNVVLLIGERPGLATAESLSAYLAHRPRRGDTDAQRNLVSNIHAAGVGPQEAVSRIIGLLDAFMLHRRSGFTIKEPASPTSLPGPFAR